LAIFTPYSGELGKNFQFENELFAPILKFVNQVLLVI